MTECERLINEGFITEEFLQPETRYDYQIPTKMKKVWAIELDLLNRFAEACKKENLKWFVGFGTLLGTIRHKGFIPWDDDLDIWMPRNDYDRLVEVGPSLFTAPYFFQTTLNDMDYYNAFARLRNSNTTGVLVSGNNDCNNGIYIDIIPLDGHYRNKNVQKCIYEYIYMRNIVAHAYAYNINPRFVTRMISKVLRNPLVHYDMKKNYLSVNRIARRNTWKEAENVGVVVFTAYPFKRNTFPKRCFENSVYKPFEQLFVPVPEGYDEGLRIIYGDYMEFPPKADRGTWHSFEFDPDVPYYEKKLIYTRGGISSRQ